MVYMNADQSGFETPAQTNFLQMAKVGSTEDVNLMVLLDRAKPKGAQHETPYLPRICRVVKDMKYPPKAEETLPAEFGNMGSERTLEHFIAYCQKEHPADKYALIIWDHGGGTHAVGGLGDEGEKTLQEFHSAQQRESVRRLPRLQRFLRQQMRRQHLPNGLLYFPRIRPEFRRPETFVETEPEADRDRDSFLYVTEIRNSLQRRFPGGKKLDVLAFDACWMQTVENAFTLQHDVEYVVGSEGTFSISGIGYEQFLTAVTRNPECSAGDVSRYLVEGTTLGQSHFKRLTISGLDLSVMPRMSQLFRELGRRCPQESDLFFQSFRFARFLCLPFYLSENQSFINIQVIDLLYFFEKLCEVLEARRSELLDEAEDRDLNKDQKEFLEASENVLETVQKMIFHGHMSLIRHKSIGASMAVHEAEQALKTWGAHGLSLFLPEHYSQWDEYIESKEWYFLEGPNRLPFVDEVPEWIAFLHRYFDWLRERYIEVL